MHRLSEKTQTRHGSGPTPSQIRQQHRCDVHKCKCLNNTHTHHKSPTSITEINNTILPTPL